MPTTAQIKAVLMKADFEQRVMALNPSMWLPFTETSGTLADNTAYTAATGPELFTNPGVVNGEGSIYTFTSDDPDGWTVFGESGNDPEVSEVASGEGHADSPTVGGGHVNIFTSGTATGLTQNVVTVGDTYRSVVDVDHVVSGAVIRTSVNGGTNIGPALTVAGVTSLDFICANTGFGLKHGTGTDDVTIAGHSVKLVGQLDGLYVNTPTLGGDTLLGLPAPTFNAASSEYVQLEHNRLNTTFNALTGSVVVAYKLSATQRADANQYAIINIGVDGNNRVYILKDAANKIRFYMFAGGANRVLSYTATSADDDLWVLLVATWDSLGNNTLYITGTSIEAGAYPAGTFTGTLAANACQIGASVVAGGNYWPNALGQAQLYNRVLTSNEVATLYNAFKAQEPNAA
jgi:hypothetical protein